MKTILIRTTAAVLLTAIATPLLAQDRPAPAYTARPSGAGPASPATALAARPAAPTPQDYVIGADDVLHVYYWRDQDLSAEAVVRPDGNISLPLLRDVAALGLTPDELGAKIQETAATYLEHPNVTVVVKQINSRKVFITGEVGKPGTYPLSGPVTVLQLIAMAGGLTPFAKQDRIVIMRASQAGPVTFTFNYKQVSQLKALHQNIVLLPGDTVLVP